MTIYDAVMVGMIVVGMIIGTIRGFAWQLASIGSLVLGYLCSHQVSAYLTPYMAEHLPGPAALHRAGSMLIAYVAISGAVFFVAWSMRRTLTKLKFEAFDRHLGMLVGGAEGAALGIIGTMFVVSLAPTTREPIFSSEAGRIVGRLMNAAGPLLPGEVRRVVSPFWIQDADSSQSPEIVADPAPRTLEDTNSEGSSLEDLARGTRAKIRDVVKDAVRVEDASLEDHARGAGSKIRGTVKDAIKSEHERMGDRNDQRIFKRR